MQTQRKVNNVNSSDFDKETGVYYNNDQNRDEQNQFNNEFFNDDVYDYKDYFLSEIPENANQDDEEDGPLAINATHNQQNYYNDANYEEYYDANRNDEDCDDINMDTFFKKVDSMELTKPKKVKIISNYLFGELLGDGSYGKVKECLDLRTLCRRAVKIINLKIVSRKIPRGLQNVRKEINIMKRLNHKNVIKLYDIFEKNTQNNKKKDVDNDAQTQHTNKTENQDGLMSLVYEKPPKVYIFMDYCMTSLEKLIKCAPNERLCNWQANFYFRQLIDGLEYLHSIGVIHNDIKPGNLLITCDDTLKICDFSISAELKLFYDYEFTSNNHDEHENDLYFNENTTSTANPNAFPLVQCTPMFQCPEMLAECIDEKLLIHNATKIDIWSSGVSLYQITTSMLPFHGSTVHQIYENIRSTSYNIPIPEFIDKNLNKLLNGMLNRDPLLRWSIKEIRECEWFRKKHPYVFDELTKWPNDVLQNETCTFRMLHYVDKLCNIDTDEQNKISHSNQMSIQQLQQPQNYTEENYSTARSFQDALSSKNNGNQDNMTSISKHKRENSDQSNKYSISNNDGSINRKTVVHNNNNNNNNHNTLPKQYTKATKIKRNNCLIN